MSGLLEGEPMLGVLELVRGVSHAPGDPGQGDGEGQGQGELTAWGAPEEAAVQALCAGAALRLHSAALHSATQQPVVQARCLVITPVSPLYHPCVTSPHSRPSCKWHYITPMSPLYHPYITPMSCK